MRDIVPLGIGVSRFSGNTMKIPKSFTHPHVPDNRSACATLQRDASRVLRRFAGDLSLRQRDFDIRARRQRRHQVEVFSLHTETLCVQIAHGPDRNAASVSFRTCRGRGDMSGGRDNVVSLDSLDTPRGYNDLLTSLRAVAGRRG